MTQPDFSYDRFTEVMDKEEIARDMGYDSFEEVPSDLQLHIHHKVAEARINQVAHLLDRAPDEKDI